MVILWLSKTLLSVGMRFFTMRGSRGPACRAMALPTEAAHVTRAACPHRGLQAATRAGGFKEVSEPLRPGVCGPPSAVRCWHRALCPSVGCHNVPLPRATSSRGTGRAAMARGVGAAAGPWATELPVFHASASRCCAEPARATFRTWPGPASSPPATRSPGDDAQGRTEATPGTLAAAPAALGREEGFLFWMRHSRVFGRFNKAFLQILENPKPLISSAAVQELLTALGGGTAKSPAEPGSTEPD